MRAGVLGALGLLLVGCGDEQAEAPPANPRIENEAKDLPLDVSALPFEVTCQGPAEELKLLGAVCGTQTHDLGWWPTDAPGGMGMYIGPVGGPYLMLFGRVEYRPPSNKNVAAELKYAAFLVNRGAADDSAETLNQWRKGEPMSSGALVTYQAYIGACSPGWMGEGTLQWRSTTLSLAWWSGLPC